VTFNLNHMCDWQVLTQNFPALFSAQKPSKLSRMPFPPTEKVSPKEFLGILSRLEFLLTNLPSQLPDGDAHGDSSQYHGFLGFSGPC
jgi:hypothetical protein